MTNVYYTEDAIVAINNAFEVPNQTKEEDRNIELFIGYTSINSPLGHSFWDLRGNEIEDTHVKLPTPEGGNFNVYVPEKFKDKFNNVEIDYKLVYSETTEEHGEIFIFRKVEDGSSTSDI